jgi:hypothetical protein
MRYHITLWLQALNRVIAHSGLVGVPPYTLGMLGNVHGFVGAPAQLSDSVVKTSEVLRQVFKKPDQDLVTLINTYWPDKNFTGLPKEM